MARRKPYVPRELPTKIQGLKRCVPSDNGGAQICVEAKKYGWSAWLTRDGKNIAPISVGRARSLDDAIRAARQNIARIRAGRRRHYR